MNFNEFAELSITMATEILTDTGHISPTVYVADANHKIIVAVIIGIPKPSWKPLITMLVKKENASYYAFADEAWYLPTPLYTGSSMKNHPYRKEMLYVFSYARDGQTNVAIKPFKHEGKKIVFETSEEFQKLIRSEWKDQLIGNVF